MRSWPDPEAAMFDDALWATCPYCGQAIDLYVDPGGGRHQRYIEDCSVCCRPIDVSAREGEDGRVQAVLRRLDE